MKSQSAAFNTIPEITGDQLLGDCNEPAKVASHHFRPPWALRFDFESTCTKCNKCIEVCPEQVLTKDQNNYPTTDFVQGHCTFCEQCVDACETTALSKSNCEKPWQQVAVISNKCLTHKNIACSVCEDSCDYAALIFVVKDHGISRPEVLSNQCNSCGACLQSCPEDAILLNELSLHTEKLVF